MIDPLVSSKTLSHVVALDIHSRASSISLIFVGIKTPLFFSALRKPCDQIKRGFYVEKV